MWFLPEGRCVQLVQRDQCGFAILGFALLSSFVRAEGWFRVISEKIVECSTKRSSGFAAAASRAGIARASPIWPSAAMACRRAAGWSPLAISINLETASASRLIPAHLAAAIRTPKSASFKAARTPARLSGVSMRNRAKTTAERTSSCFAESRKDMSGGTDGNQLERRTRPLDHEPQGVDPRSALRHRQAA